MPAVSLGIVTAEREAAARRAAAAQRAAAAAPPPLTSEEARQQSQAEGLTLRVADSKTGYLGVHFRRLLTDDHPKPYRAQLKRSGVPVNLGYFATAVEAAMCVARTPEGRAAAERAAAAPTPLTSEEARQQAQAEGLILLAADNNKAGYYGVRLTQPGHGKPYQARVIRGSKDGRRMSLGNFATVEEAALCVARSPEGQAVAAARAAAAPPLTSEEAVQQARDATIRAALDIIYEAAGAAAAELCAEVAAEVMAGIALGL